MNHRRFRPDVVPDQRGDHRNQHHGRDEDRRNLVGKPPYGRFGSLGLLNQFNDLRQGRFTAHAGGLVDNRTVGVQRAGGHLITLRFADRHGLTGKHAFVDAGRAFGNHAIHRQLFARADPDMITLANLFHREILLFTVADYPRGFRPQVQQTTHCLRGFALGPQLQSLTQVDQADNHRRRLKIDMAGHFRQRPRDTCHDNGIEPGGAGTQCNQGVHVGIVVPECLPGASVEMPAGGGHHDQGQHAQAEPGALVGVGHHHGAEPHAPDHQPEPEAQADGHLHQQCLVLLAVFLLFTIIGLVFILDDAGAVAGTLNRFNQSVGTGSAGSRGSVIGQVHVGMADTGNRHQGFFNGVDARRAGRTGYRQMNLLVRARC